MVTLENDELVFRFPDEHEDAVLGIEFQRTLRIPDDSKDYPLPPGLGRFPVRHVDDHATRVPASWIEHGGVMLPMYQSEALWINFRPHHGSRRPSAYPFLVKVAAGKINAVSGAAWDDMPHRDSQDYVTTPKQPWLDGYCVERGVIRQFVAMPLGAGYSAEEQITGKAEHGGIQIVVYPMKRDVYERRFPKRDPEAVRVSLACAGYADAYPTLMRASIAGGMGLGAGGRMRQEIFDDPFSFEDWDLRKSSRCFLHIANSMVWSDITGRKPPTTPPTAREYTSAGLPWFDYYDDGARALEGSKILDKIKSVVTLGNQKGEVPVPENQPVEGETVIDLRAGMKPGQVREGKF